VIQGSCSVCGISMRSHDGSTYKSRPTSKSVTNRNPHNHKLPWSFIADENPGDYRYWHDYAPNIVTN